jgi:hypothetical protein
VALVAAALAVPALIGLLVERVEDEPVGAHFRSTLGARIGRFELRSSAVRRTLLPLIVRPAGAREGERRPLLVLLHARGMPPEFFLADGVFEGLRAAGRRAPLLALVDGGAEAPSTRRSPPPPTASARTRAAWRSAASRSAASAR